MSTHTQVRMEYFWLVYYNNLWLSCWIQWSKGSIGWILSRRYQLYKYSTACTEASQCINIWCHTCQPLDSRHGCHTFGRPMDPRTCKRIQTFEQNYPLTLRAPKDKLTRNRYDGAQRKSFWSNRLIRHMPTKFIFPSPPKKTNFRVQRSVWVHYKSYLQ